MAKYQESNIRRTRLSNGLVVVTEQMPYVRSVSFGIFLRVGSRVESRAENGLTHFIEHALFKGTRKRSAAEIAEESDALGGHLDAFTGREMVGFHTKVLDRHLSRAFELLADLVTAPAFESSEIEKERNVILEEIKMVEDTPDDLVFEIFSERFYPRHPLGRSILGTPSTLRRFKRPVVAAYYDRLYRADNLVIAAAGNLEHGEIAALARKYFGRLRPSEEKITPAAPRAAPHITLRHKAELEQSHLVIGAPCPSLLSADRYATHLMTLLLGGGMSSRLFQSIREDRGLAYTVFSSISPFTDAGYLSIYAGASTEQLPETIAATMEELRRIKREPVPQEELERNQEQLKSSLMLNLESSSARMSSLAQQEMNFGRFFSSDEIMTAVDAVTAGDVQRLANQIFRRETLAVTVLGNLEDFNVERRQLQC
ncbi:MAG: insulinase family protein [Blastocatellales bacterium]|nr:insulinase family protein [Blastocatellales bacterium]